jgi:hypothetical protein
MLLMALALVGVAGPVWADATAFIGVNASPANRVGRGLSVGAGFLVVAFEFEYAATTEDVRAGAPALKTGAGNVLLQTPFMIHGVQPYVTAGAGLYRERLGTQVDTNVSPNTGVGLKVKLAGPLRLRLDYRLFKLRGGALYTPAHRVYVGLNLKF